MVRALAIVAVCAALLGCNEVSHEQRRAKQDERRAVFVQCMHLAAQITRQADDDVADIVTDCDDIAAWQTAAAPPLAAPQSEGGVKP